MWSLCPLCFEGDTLNTDDDKDLVSRGLTWSRCDGHMEGPTYGVTEPPEHQCFASRKEVKFSCRLRYPTQK